MERTKEEVIIKQGQVKHKEGGVFSLDRWKPRTAVLKNLPTGRLQFVLLDNKGVEKYQVPIEEYYGIYVNPKPDGNEKYTISVISDRTTDMLSFGSEEVMHSWGDVIQEKFGRVLVINITIPHRQHQLKQGFALLIIRDNAITITTTDQPPKLQCSFLIRHIKKYGDFDNGFVFETGNKCPKGEKTFLIRCNNNKKLYSLLDGLAKRSMTIQDIILRQKFGEIAAPQGSIPKPATSPSFNFSKLQQPRSKVRSTSDVAETKKPPNHHKFRQSFGNALDEPTLPYYNVESGGDSYWNLGPDGKSSVPEVEYEIIPEDDVFTNRDIKRHQRGSVPAPANNYRNIDASKAATMGTSRHRGDTSDKEYMNLDVPPSTSKGDGDEYVVMKTGSVQNASDNYINLDLASSQTIDKPVPPVKDGENSSDNYVNYDPTSQTAEKKSKADNYVNFDPTSQTRSQSSDDKPALPSKGGENSSDNYVNFDPVSRAVEKKSEFHVSDSYVNFSPTSQDSSVKDSHALDSQYANLDYSKKSGIRRHYSSPGSHKRPPTTSSNMEQPHHHIVFHTFPSDESLNSKPGDERAMSVSEPKNDDSTDYTAHPVIGPSEVTRPQQQSGPSETSGCENLMPVNQSTGTDSQPVDSEYELMTPVAAQYEQAVTKQPQQPTAGGYEDFVPVKARNNCPTQIDQDNCPNSAYSVLQFQTDNSHSAKPIQKDSSPYSQLSHSQKVTRSTSSNYSKLELSAPHESPKTDHLPNQNKPPVLPRQTPEKPLVPSRELKKRVQQRPESSSFYSVYPELPPRNPSFQGVIHAPIPPPVPPPAGPKPVSYALSPNQSSSSLNYSEVMVLPAEIGQPKFRPRVVAIDQTTPTQKSSDNYAIIDRDASLGLQKALEQQEHDRLA